MTYAVIALSGKQYRVREGQWLLVDRVPHDEGATFAPDVLLVGGNGEAKLGDDAKGVKVQAIVTEHLLGKKVVVGKHRQRTGYRRRNGHRSRLSKIEIQSIGTARRAPAKEAEAPAEKPAAKPRAAAKPKAAAKPRAAAKPKPAAKPKAPARKPAKPNTEGKNE
jgi:large subunit ribosomal protein L21